VQELCALVVVRLVPRLLRGVRRQYGRIDLRGRGLEELADDLLGRRIDDSYAGFAATRHLMTIDLVSSAQMLEKFFDAHGLSPGIPHRSSSG